MRKDDSGMARRTHQEESDVILSQAKSSAWRRCGNGRDSFEVQLRNPSYDDRLSNQAIQSQYAMSGTRDRVQCERDRIEWCLRFVCGWRDVYGEDGTPVNYSPTDLELLIVAHPRVMAQIVTHVEELLSADLSEDQRGN